MTYRKDLIVAVLATSCLTTTLFAMTHAVPSYDPWIDINDDGVINMRDIGIVCNAFGASAPGNDTTKNVNVTNWPQDRPLTIEKGIQKITVVDSLASGVLIDYTVVFGSSFYFEFAPIGGIINITNVYINAIWGTTYNNLYLVCFRVNHGSPYQTLVESCQWIRGRTHHPTTLDGLTSGVNELDIYRPSTDPSGSVYLYRLELLIEYFYYG